MNYLLRKEKCASEQECSTPSSRAGASARSAKRARLSTHLRDLRGDESAELRVPIRAYSDILEARKQGRELAAGLGFSSVDCTLIATAISELARNIVLYAGEGEIRLGKDDRLGSTGIVITAADRGPGIRDIRNAMQEGYSTSHGLGLGLPGVKRIMDDFDIESKPRQGVTVTVKKWKAQ